MAHSISSPAKSANAIPPKTTAPATTKASIKMPIKAPVVAKAPAPATAAPAKEPKAPKPAKVERVIETDATTGLARNQPHSFRWVCLDALHATWPESKEAKDFSQELCTEKCKELYTERGGKKDISDEEWGKQIGIIRAWLRSKGVNKPLPGDVTTRAEMTDEQKAALKERLAAGRAKKSAAKKGANASVDEQDAEAEAAVEE